MTRSWHLITAQLVFAMILVSFNSPRIAQAQTPREDTIRFMAATRGNDYNGDNLLEWCVSKTWHPGYRDLRTGNLGPATSIDQLAQWGTGYANCSSDPNRTGRTEPVDLWAYGFTNDTSCTLLAPCASLYVEVRTKLTAQQCDFIEARLLDNTPKRDFRGRQRALHASGSNLDLRLSAASNGWHLNWTTLGVAVNDSDCRTTPTPEDPDGDVGWTGWHVHQDFMPPNTSENCQWDKNAALFSTGSTDWKKQNLDHWLHLVAHKPGVACIVPGPRGSDFILREGGELDGPIAGSGEGARSLATTGGPITTSSTCFTGTSWCGTMTVTQPVLLAARQWYLNNVQYPPPPSQSGAWVRWYEDAAGYFFDVFYSRASPGGGTYCGVTVGDGAPLYFLYVRSSVNFVECGQTYGNTAFPSVSMTMSTVRSAFGKFRGQGGACPGCPPTQEEANTWTDVEIAMGNWATKVKPAIDAVIRAAANTGDMAALGITGNPPFDGDLGDVGMAGIMNRPNTLASRITGPLLSHRGRDEVNRDWILSSRLRWEPDNEDSKLAPD